MASSTLTLDQLLASGLQSVDPVLFTLGLATFTHDNFTRVIPAKPIDGIHDIYMRETTRPTVSLNSVSEAVTESQAVRTRYTKEVGHLHAQLSLDDKIIMGHNLGSGRAWPEQLDLAGLEIARKWGYYVAEGNASTDADIEGLRYLANNAGSSQKYVAATTTTGASLTTVILDKMLEKLAFKNQPAAFVMCQAHLTDYKQVVQANGALPTIEFQDDFGRFNSQAPLNIPSYAGVPIFTSDHIAVETTYSGGSKYRIYLVSLGPQGLRYFYPKTDKRGRPTALGLTMDDIHRKEGYTEDILGIHHWAGLSLLSNLGIVHAVNVKITNT